MPGLPSVTNSSQAWASVGTMWSTSLNEGWLPEWAVGSTGGFAVPCSPSSSGYIFYSTGDGTTGASGNSFYSLGRKVRVVQGSTTFMSFVASAVASSGITTVGLSSGSMSPTAGLSTGVAFTSIAAGTESPQSLAGSTSSATATKFHREDGTWAIPAGSLAGGQSASATISGDITRALDSFGDATGLSVTITTTGGDVLIWFSGTITTDTADTATYFTLDKDGGNVAGTLGLVNARPQSTGDQSPVSFVWRDAAPTSASHTYKIQWASSAGQTSTLLGNPRASIVVLELPS